jgi:hypothetical protein
MAEIFVDVSDDDDFDETQSVLDEFESLANEISRNQRVLASTVSTTPTAAISSTITAPAIIASVASSSGVGGPAPFQFKPTGSPAVPPFGGAGVNSPAALHPVLQSPNAFNGLISSINSSLNISSSNPFSASSGSNGSSGSEVAFATSPKGVVYDRLTNPSNFTGSMKTVFQDVQKKQQKVKQIKSHKKESTTVAPVFSANKLEPHLITTSSSVAASSVSHPGGTASGATTKFRRRDGDDSAVTTSISRSTTAGVVGNENIIAGGDSVNSALGAQYQTDVGEVATAEIDSKPTNLPRALVDDDVIMKNRLYIANAASNVPTQTSMASRFNTPEKTAVASPDVFSRLTGKIRSDPRKRRSESSAADDSAASSSSASLVPPPPPTVQSRAGVSQSAASTLALLNSMKRVYAESSEAIVSTATKDREYTSPLPPALNPFAAVVADSSSVQRLSPAFYHGSERSSGSVLLGEDIPPDFSSHEEYLHNEK